MQAEKGKRTKERDGKKGVNSPMSTAMLFVPMTMCHQLPGLGDDPPMLTCNLVMNVDQGNLSLTKRDTTITRFVFSLTLIVKIFPPFCMAGIPVVGRAVRVSSVTS